MSSTNAPAIGSIKNFDDVKRALDNIRNWVVANQAIAQLPNVSGIVSVDQYGNCSGKAIGVDIQGIGDLVNLDGPFPATNLTVDVGTGEVSATAYYQITVKGTVLKILVLE
jgi:hypothetical protein